MKDRRTLVRHYPRLLPLFLFLAVAVVQLVGCSSPGGNTPPGNDGPNALDDLEREIIIRVNQYRQSKGLPPLVSDDRLAGQARIHSLGMADGDVPFGHDGFLERIKAAGIPCLAAAENVAMNGGFEDPAAEAVRGWLNSPGHRANIEGDYDLTGVGAAVNGVGEYYFTQIFLETI